MLFICSTQIQLSVSTSSLSDGFSLDTVGSYGCVRCPATSLDYLVNINPLPPPTINANHYVIISL